ncbi:Rad9-domain-containing protein [Phellopilus nigrolimitatus]|nr:Rad9-domain-containing protein [Phellopilus nigrolimitatus]
MQATLDARALKPFTRALTCIAKYGDEMILHAGPDTLVLTSMNQPKTAFCSFTYGRTFFQRYALAQPQTQTKGSAAGPSRSGGQDSQEERVLKCQLQTKSLLSILKHRNTDRSAEKCELTIIDGVDMPDEEVRDDEDTLESRLIVRLHCKYGVIKTHRLLLNNPTNDDAPVIQSGENESRIVVQARAMKEIIEHFPNSKGPKSDPELIWRFDDDEVRVKSMEKGIDAKGKSQLATELTLGADEFDIYDVMLFPLTIGFFLREFNAAVTLAESLFIPIDVRFTRPPEPVYISAEGDDCTMLFVIATNQVRGEDADVQPQPRTRTNNQATHRSASGMPTARKRALEDDGHVGPARKLTVVQQARNGPGTGSQHAPLQSRTDVDVRQDHDSMGMAPEPEPFPPPSQSQPLFLASQLSVADMDAIRESGLGIEDMDADEFAAMLDGEGEEVSLNRLPQPPTTSNGNANGNSRPGSGSAQEDELEYDELDEDSEMGPTQVEREPRPNSEKAFRPLFAD